MLAAAFALLLPASRVLAEQAPEPAAAEALHADVGRLDREGSSDEAIAAAERALARALDPGERTRSRPSWRSRRDQ